MKRMQLRAIAALVAVFSVFFAKSPVYAQLVDVAEIPTSNNVSAVGAFEYSLPLRIPPGVQSMMPDLAITYSSNSGNGILGKGWSLQGLSAITRGLPTIYHNQDLSPVDFNNDVFFLDGQRLFQTAQNSDHYFTEVKNFAEIHSYGTIGNPTHFIVKSPSGLIYEYGTNTGRFIAQGRTDVLMWCVDKISDQNGNFILFNYTNDATNGEYRISSITYGQNTNFPGTGCNNKIEFEYITRQDKNKVWVGGSFVQSNVVLSKIHIEHTDGTQANEYKFTYDNINDISRLVKIEEMRNGTYALSPINISWGATASQVTDLNITPINGGAYSAPITGDFNGDGYTDYVLYSYGTAGTMKKYLNDKSGGFIDKGTSAYPTPGSRTGVSMPRVPPYDRMIFDYDGDGLDDIIIINYDNTSSLKTISIYLIRANGGSTVFDAPAPIYYDYNNASNNTRFSEFVKIVPGDYDGDGKKELMILQPYNFTSSSIVADYEFFIVGDEYSTYLVPRQIHHWALGHIEIAIPTDYNGDGRSEISITRKIGTITTQPKTFLYELILTYNATTLAPQLVQTSTSWPMQQLSISHHPYGTDNFPYYATLYPGDFNGDGKTDLLSWDQVGWEWLLAYSDGSYPAYTNTPPVWLPGTSLPLQDLSKTAPTTTAMGLYSTLVADFNGDGLDDVLELKGTTSGGSDYQLFYSTGASFVKKSGYVDIRSDEKFLSIGDFNGDGQADVFCAIDSVSYKVRYLMFDKDNRSLKVVGITHADKSLAVEYKTLPQDNEYLPEPVPLVYPYITTRTMPLTVVKRMQDGMSVDNKYVYKSSYIHAKGLGFRGFRYVESVNKANQKFSNSYSLTSRVPFLSESIMFNNDLLVTSSTTCARKTNYLQIDEPGSTDGRSRIIHNYEYEVADFIDAYYLRNTITVGSTAPGSVFYDYGKIASIEAFKRGIWAKTEKIEYTYDPGASFINRGKPISTKKTNAGGTFPRTTSFTYDLKGRVATETTDPATTNQNVTTYTYDLYGNTTKTSLAASGISGTIDDLFTYTADGRFLKTTENALGYKTENFYTNLNNSWGTIWRTKGIDGLFTEFEYDRLNRKIKTTDVSNGTYARIQYLTAPHTMLTGLTGVYYYTTSGVHGQENDISLIYDKYHRVIREVSHKHNFIFKDYTYNDAGLLASSTTPYPENDASLAVTTTYEYDIHNREIERETSDGVGKITTTYVYNHTPGLQVIEYKEETNQATGINVASRSTEDKVVEYSFGNSNSRFVQNSYHTNGMIESTSANFQITEYEYDAFERLSSKTAPNVGQILYEYNSLGQLTKESLNDGTSTEYEYDKLGRIIRKRYNGNPQAYNYTYGLINWQPETGKLLSVTSPGNTHTKTYTYNSLGQLQGETEADLTNSFTSNYTYDQYGRMLTRRFPTGDRISYIYEMNRVLRVTLNNSPLGLTTPTVLWHANGANRNHLGQIGRCEYTDLFNAANQDNYRSYDKFGNLVNSYISGSGGTIVDMSYEFDPATGNLLWRKDNILNNTENFQYDHASRNERLTKVTQDISGMPGPDLDMTYDNTGNILKKSDVSNSTANWKYNAYALTQVPEPQTSMMPYEIPLNTQAATYTLFQKVETINESNENEVVFTYGAEQNRFKASYFNLATATPAITKYYANEYEKIVDDVTGDVEHISYIYVEGEPVIMLRHKVATGAPIQSSINFVHTDYLGSITHIMHQGMVDERSYDAWGRVRDPQTWVPYTSNNFPTTWLTDRGYTGQEHLRLSIWNNNIINLNGRLYDPLVGRMFSTDPYVPDLLNSQDYNKYIYARNNPLKYNDPDGEWVQVVGAIVGGIVGGGLNLYNNWDKVDNLSLGLQYFGSGAAGGAVGVFNPAAGTAITSGANIAIDVANGKAPKMHTLTDYAQYVGMTVLDANSATGIANIAGSGAKSLSRYWLERGIGGKGAINYSKVTVVDDAGQAVKVSHGTLPEYTHVATSTTKPQGGLNLFKFGKPETVAPNGWKPGDRMLKMFDKGSPKANWRQNSGYLRREMRNGKPINDSYRLPNGELIPTNGFLNAERSLLQSRGWMYNPSQGAWLPPIR